VAKTRKAQREMESLDVPFSKVINIGLIQSCNMV
jgi:hypothetical protein